MEFQAFSKKPSHRTPRKAVRCIGVSASGYTVFTVGFVSCDAAKAYIAMSREELIGLVAAMQAALDKAKQTT